MNDVVQANMKAAMISGISGAYNIDSGIRVTISHLVVLSRVSGIVPRVHHGPPRPGDVRHSLADISAPRQAFGFSPDIPLEEGLAEYLSWIRQSSLREARRV